MSFEDALARLIDTEGITKEHIAAAAGKSVFAVVSWLKGKNEPRISDVLRIIRSYPSFAALLEKVAA